MTFEAFFLAPLIYTKLNFLETFLAFEGDPCSIKDDLPLPLMHLDCKGSPILGSNFEYP